MKKIILLFLFTVLLVECTIKINSKTDKTSEETPESKAACAEKSNLETEQLLLQMLNKKDFFNLEKLLEEKMEELPKGVVLYIEAHIRNAFNQTEQSLQIIDTLLNNYSNSLNDTLFLGAFKLKYDNLYKQYRYSEAADAMKTAIDKYGYACDDITKLQNAYNIVEPLKGLPQQKMHITSDVTIPASLNQYNHIVINISNGKQSENFMFDTGASNIVSESSAQKLGIRVLESSATTIGAADKKVQTKVGIAETLWIGNLMFENVVFKVMSDELLTFPEADYIIHGIIGFPIINQMKKIEIRKNENITVFAYPRKRNLRNMFLYEGHLQILQFEANNDTVLFIMDTGANVSKFSEKYFTANSIEIKDKATKNTITRAGIGGVVNSEVYDLKNVKFKIGGRELTIPKIAVLTDKLSYLENFDGHLGQDVLICFNKLILNYEDMYFTFED